MKTHIALVGGQPIPVYLGIKWSGALDKLILVCSEQSKDEAERLAICCQKIPHEIVFCNPVNLSEIEECALQIKQAVGDGDVDLNLTSGTKPWTLVFYKVFSTLPLSRFIMVDQNNRIQDLHTHEESYESIPTELRFLLYGAKLTKYTPFSDYTEEDKKVMQQVQKIRKRFFKAFNALTIGKQVESKVGEIQSEYDPSYVTWDDEDQWVRFSLYNKKSNYCEDFLLRSPHVKDIVFNSGWFELKSAIALSKNKHAREIWLNCEFAAQDNLPKNELDIVIDMGKKLLCVECKTQVKDITAIDKFHSAIKNFSGTSTKGLFLVNDIPSEKNHNYVHAVEKCKDNDILLYNFSIYDKGETKLSLNDMIDGELDKTNKR